MPRLTKRIVDEAVPRKAAFFVWCSDLPGFGVRVFPGGRKAYYVDYRADGVRRRMKVGDHGAVTCDEGRKLALATLGGVVKGGDPLLDKRTRRDSITVAELCEQYMEAAEKGLIFGKRRLPKKAYTIIQDRARIDRHISPLLGRKLVKDLTRGDVARFIRDVTAGRTAVDLPSDKPRGRIKVTGGAGTATRAANFLGAVLQWALHESLIETNVAHGVKRQADGKRTRRLTPDEFAALGAALREAEKNRETWQGVAGVKLLALTGCRLGEVVRLRWREVDDVGHAFRLADTKEGTSVRPIGSPAFEVLKALPRDGGSYVLPGARGADHYGSLDSFLDRVVKRAELEGVTAHVLRHSFASVAADLGYSESTIAAMLGHAAGTVTGRYTHHLDSVLLAAADRVAGEIAAMMAGSGAHE